MCKGLGRTQALMLRAMMSLEAEVPCAAPYDPRKTGRHFYVWAILERAWQMSPDLGQRADADEAYRASSEAGRRRKYWRRQRHEFPAFFEKQVNPPRTLASLAKRGLVHRWSPRGNGSAGLTPPAGTRVAARS